MASAIAAQPSGTPARNWRKSRRCFTHHDCAEVGSGSPGVLVRDTREAGQPGRTVLAFSAGAWREFTDRLRESLS